jgi:thiol:disulfide interchange protein DsbA
MNPPKNGDSRKWVPEKTKTAKTKTAWIRTVAVGLALSMGWLPGASSLAAVPAGLNGDYKELKEPSTHSPGKVKLTEFADFYCPHCHSFEQVVIPALKKEFGDRLEVTMIGFPVIPGKLPTAFEMYEQAKMMGKGAEMKQVLFRSIHKDQVQIFDRVLREAIAKEVGLDPVAFEAGLASGKPVRALEEGKKMGMRVNIQQTPTVVLDGNIKVETLSPDNLKTLIQSILDADKKR